MVRDLWHCFVVDADGPIERGFGFLLFLLIMSFTAWLMVPLWLLGRLLEKLLGLPASGPR